jgi:hypothetical protein
MDTDKEKCAICEKDGSIHSRDSFYSTCDAHHEHATKYQKEIIKLRLGYINDLPENMKKCFYCKEPLTKEEIDSIKDTDFNIVCTIHDHSGGRNWLQRNILHWWLKTKEENPEKDWSRESDREEFMEKVQTGVFHNQERQIAIKEHGTRLD